MALASAACALSVIRGALSHALVAAWREVVGRRQRIEAGTARRQPEQVQR